MKLITDAEASAWLAKSLGFEWDDGNRTKSAAKHGVLPDDTEAVFAGVFVFAGRIVEPAHSEPRWLVLGCDSSGRHLTVVFTRRGERIRVISCRAMRAAERKAYEEANEE